MKLAYHLRSAAAAEAAAAALLASAGSVVTVQWLRLRRAYCNKAAVEEGCKACCCYLFLTAITIDAVAGVIMLASRGATVATTAASVASGAKYYFRCQLPII